MLQSMCVDFLFARVVLVNVALFQYLKKLLINGINCISLVKYDACEIVRYWYSVDWSIWTLS